MTGNIFLVQLGINIIQVTDVLAQKGFIFFRQAYGIFNDCTQRQSAAAVFFKVDRGRNKRPGSSVYGRVAAIQADNRIIGLSDNRPVMQEKIVGNICKFFKGFIIIS